jgi:enterochelin esterase-like enzyme
MRRIWSVSLTGWPFLALLIAITVLILIAVYVGWNRWPQVVALPSRLIGLALIMVLGAALAGDVLNRGFNFYSSFGDLFGVTPGIHAFAVTDAPKADARVVIKDSRWLTKGALAARTGQGILLDVSYPGARSGITRDGQLYLPAAYFAGRQDLSFAAVELFHGFPGHPSDFQRNVHLRAMLDDEISNHRMPPAVVVIPQTYVDAVTECVNSISGQQDETYLAQDVYDDVVTSLRVQEGRTWAAIGVSTGGLCAVNLGLHHPERYAAAASISGQYTAGEDPGAGRLFGGHGKFGIDVNSPLWWVTHRNPVAPPLYLFASSGDPDAVKEASRMAAALQKHAKGLPTTYALLPDGGHNWGVWSAAVPPALDWLAQYLPGPLAPAEMLPTGPS